MPHWKLLMPALRNPMPQVQNQMPPREQAFSRQPFVFSFMALSLYSHWRHKNSKTDEMASMPTIPETTPSSDNRDRIAIDYVRKMDFTEGFSSWHIKWPVKITGEVLEKRNLQLRIRNGHGRRRSQIGLQMTFGNRSGTFRWKRSGLARLTEHAFRSDYRRRPTIGIGQSRLWTFGQYSIGVSSGINDSRSFRLRHFRRNRIAGHSRIHFRRRRCTRFIAGSRFPIIAYQKKVQENENSTISIRRHEC